MFTRAVALTIDETQKQQLEAWARAGTTPQRVARQGEAILLASQGISNRSIAQQTGLSRPTVLALGAQGSRRGITGSSQLERFGCSGRRLEEVPANRTICRRRKIRSRGKDSCPVGRAHREIATSSLPADPSQGARSRQRQIQP